MTTKRRFPPVRLILLLALCPLAGFGQTVSPLIPEKLASVVPTTVLGAQFDSIVFSPVSRAVVLARMEPPEGVHATFEIDFQGDPSSLTGAPVPSTFRIWVYDLADSHDEYVAAVLDWGHGMRVDRLFGFPALVRHPPDPATFEPAYAEVLIDGRFAVGAVSNSIHSAEDIFPPIDVLEVLKDLDVVTLANALRTVASLPDADYLPDIPTPFAHDADIGRPFPSAFGAWNRSGAIGRGGALFGTGNHYEDDHGRLLTLALHRFRSPEPPSDATPSRVIDTSPPPERAYREYYWNWAKRATESGGSLIGIPLYAGRRDGSCVLSAWLYDGRMLASAATDPARWEVSECTDAEPILLEALSAIDYAGMEAALGIRP
jgi:hypothetical protein